MKERINLDNFSHYVTDGKGGVLCKRGLVKRATVSLTDKNGKRANISVAKLTYHQHIGKLEPTDLVKIHPLGTGDYLSNLYKVGKNDPNPQRNKKTTQLERAEICYYYEVAKYNIAVLTQIYKISDKAVRSILLGQTSGCQGSQRYISSHTKKGRGCNFQKVTEEIKVEIICLFSKGWNRTAIAKKLGLTIPTVSKYINKNNN